MARGGPAGPVRQRRRKRQRLGEFTVPADRLRAERPDQVWAIDFGFDQAFDGRAIKLLNIVDEFTREALAMHAAHNVTADDTVRVFESLRASAALPSTCAATTAPS